jgi:hypothetical protein
LKSIHAVVGDTKDESNHSLMQTSEHCRMQGVFLTSSVGEYSKTSRPSPNTLAYRDSPKSAASASSKSLSLHLLRRVAAYKTMLAKIVWQIGKPHTMCSALHRASASPELPALAGNDQATVIHHSEQQTSQSQDDPRVTCNHVSKWFSDHSLMEELSGTLNALDLFNPLPCPPQPQQARRF